MNCQQCARTGPEGVGHYHIVVAHGEVTEVWFVSGSGYWDRQLEPWEYTVVSLVVRTEHCEVCHQAVSAEGVIVRENERLCVSCDLDKHPEDYPGLY